MEKTIFVTCARGFVKAGVLVEPPAQVRRGQPLPWSLAIRLDTGSLPGVPGVSDWSFPRWAVDTPIYADIFLVTTSDNLTLATAAVAALPGRRNGTESTLTTEDASDDAAAPVTAAAAPPPPAASPILDSPPPGLIGPRPPPYDGPPLSGIATFLNKVPVRPVSPPQEIIVYDAFASGGNTVRVAGSWHSDSSSIVFLVPAEMLRICRTVEPGVYQFWFKVQTFRGKPFSFFGEQSRPFSVVDEGALMKPQFLSEFEFSDFSLIDSLFVV
ncbi:hypothetical protein B0T14DRAFT_567938 [Immersiella caudata]|uniref:Uncharacterized protein n=1 Tax=Immersiella caudata TaxID=314043 RepID=A0AA39WJ26_9PEZI|nr:hypothetical protein B0T14DRAFT_567938 [Immersiella caudata]